MCFISSLVCVFHGLGKLLFVHAYSHDAKKDSDVETHPALETGDSQWSDRAHY